MKHQVRPGNQVEAVCTLENLLTKLGLKTRFALPVTCIAPMSGSHLMMYQRYLKVNGILIAELLATDLNLDVYGQHVAVLNVGDVVTSRNSLHIHQL